MTSLVSSLDDAWLKWLNSFAHQWPLLDKSVKHLLRTDELKFGLLVAMFYWLWFRADGERQMRRAVLVMTALGGIAGLFIARLLAILLPFRQRPLGRADLDFIMPLDYEPVVRTWSAFPSDHAVAAFALSTGFWLVSRPIGAVAFLHSFVLICLPRMYFGLHHASDVIGGALIGILVTLLLNRESLRRPVSSHAIAMEERFPGLFYTCFFLLFFEIATMFNGLRGLVGAAFKVIHGGS